LCSKLLQANGILGLKGLLGQRGGERVGWGSGKGKGGGTAEDSIKRRDITFFPQIL